MIKVNTCHIGDEPLPVNGTESSDILDINAAPEAPEMNNCVSGSQMQRF